MKKYLPVAILLSLFFVLALTSVRTKSPVCDAAAHHIASGYSYVKVGDFRMNPSAPPLLRIFMGIPILALNPPLPIDHPSWEGIDSPEFHRQFLFVGDKNTELIIFLSRLPMIILSLFLGILIFIWARQIYGYKAALFALFLFSLSPTMLANAPLAMLDMGCAFFMFLFFFQLWRYLNNKTLLNLVLTGICFGLAQSTKITAVILYPLSILFILVDFFISQKTQRLSLLKILARIIIIWFIGIIVLWASYFFEFKPLLVNAPDVEEKIGYIRTFAQSLPFIDSEHLSERLVYFAKNVPIPLSTYIVTLLGVVHLMLSDYPVYFMGNMVHGGSRIYYLIDFLIKTPIPFILLIALSFIFIRRRTRTGLLTKLFIVVPLITFFLSASNSKLQCGVRYLLPMYPFMFLWVSDLVNINLKRNQKVFKALIVVCGIWYLAASVFSYPDYLAYFNGFTGGMKGSGYKITHDADWGQDMKALKIYMDKEGVERVRILCFGVVDPSYYKIDYKNMTQDEFIAPIKGAYYAISMRYLQSVEWTDTLKPVERVGGTIFIYHIEE